MTDEEMAEEYIKANNLEWELECHRISPIGEVKQAFQKGAEFGYNKAKEDADKMKSRFLELCNLKDMRIAELEKTNEWHEIESKVSPKREISKQYMPKNKEKVLLKYHFSGDNEIHISDGYYDTYDFEFHIANNPKFRIVCVIAWREFPKKENE